MAVLGLPAALHGDFDRDGKPDTARIVQSASGERQVVVRRAAATTDDVLPNTQHTAASDFFLNAAHAGRWRTACAKGLGRDNDPCARKVVVMRGGEISFGTRESTEWVAIWDGRKFETVQLSD
jgi:hypothetical protein